jgi:hypothetical protein
MPSEGRPSRTNNTVATNSSCPCKYISFSLSSFTAAEYGVLHGRRSNTTICNKKAKDATSTYLTSVETCHGYSLLHFTAQHGHVASTSYLLERGADPDVGSCGATPLHRASYSGAVGTMKLLLDAQRHPISSLSSSLLAKDISFSSNENPLHKAASGGRYLAVQLLLFYLIKADANSCHGQTDNNLATLPTLLQQALQAKDSMGRTPLDISQQQLKMIHNTNNNYDNDLPMVASSRWDIVSGGQANWYLCSKLLQLAEKEDYNYVLRLLFSDGTDSSLSLLLHKLYTESTSVKETPARFCDVDYPLQTCSYNDTSCTVGSSLSSWEQSYFETLKSTLQDSFQLLLGTNTATTVILPSEEADGSKNDIVDSTIASDSPSNQIDCKAAAAASSSMAISNEISVRLAMTLTSHDESSPSKNKKFCLGCSCHGCGTSSLTLFRGTRNKQLLYCRRCSRHY